MEARRGSAAAVFAPADVWTEQGRLARVLGAWSAVSMVAGAVCLALGWRRHNPLLSGCGRQSVAWGVVDGAIAAFGARTAGEDRAGAAGDQAVRARHMRNILGLNAGLDVGYLATGAAMTRRPPTRHDGLGVRTKDVRGDGLAVIVQGAFLLALDTAYARRMADLARGEDEG